MGCFDPAGLPGSVGNAGDLSLQIPPPRSGWVSGSHQEDQSTARRAYLLRCVDDVFARQMIRQRPAHRLAAFRAGPIRFWPARGRGARGLAFFEVFKLEFKLMDLLIQRLGRPAKLHPAQLVQLGLILRDEQMRAG